MLAAKHKQQLHLELQEQEQLTQWVASRDIAASTGTTPQERLDS